MKDKASGPGAGTPTSKCPENTALKQQQLPAWKPVLTASTVLSGFFTIGGFCLGMGILLILSAKSVQEIEINYTEICSNCSKLRENSSNFEKECDCSIPFSISKKMKGNVFLYYKLHNFYQNHRRYVISRSDAQLLGENVKKVESTCAPFTAYANGTPISPCGAIANSMFNDTILLFYHPNDSTRITVPLLKSGITWWTDKHVKFQNPKSRNLSAAFAGTARPPYWNKPIYELDEKDWKNNGFTNDDFIVWMRVAAFPTFKNLYRRLSRIQQFAEGLPAGNYSFTISYNFPVTRFKGEKGVLLSTVTWSGGSNIFLGVAYITTGAATLLAGSTMLAIHLKLKKRKTHYQR
ncbi:cell cycle control protein 50C-like isoform X1 [Tachyglossus aculeatus]|uniref:cell cycle control protein 50C-like isoform X1 n=1 Tax=Tachyglossus aculeatus TaxID=9261 RepID=UPI0018F5512D|nr:cell cycle control protein 50C-like isoform X1 [Tachyglossus aculeatus]